MMWLLLFLSVTVPEGVFLWLTGYLKTQNANEWLVGGLPPLAGVGTICLLFGVAKLIERIWPIKEERIGDNY